MPVNIIEIPKRADGSDQGIDDYLGEGGLLEDLEVRAFEEGWMPPEDWPELPEEALHGPAGKVVEHIRPNTEADPVAILSLFLASFGNACGRGAHFTVEDTRHYLKLFTVIVGESSKSRKGTAQGRINKLISRLDDGWAAKCFKQGLSSGEGVIHHVRDKKIRTDNKDGKLVVMDEGVSEKRLLVEEEEFASVLIMMAREGSILSTILRSAWDDKRLAIMTKNSSETASDTHITVVGHITRDELLRHMTSNKLGGGIANRFSFFLVRRSKLLSRGGGHEEWPEGLIEELRAAVEFGKVKRCIDLCEEPEREYGGRSAGGLWDEVYPELSEAAPGLFGVVTSRAEAQVRRIATLYAVLDRSRVVRVAHLLAALALWEYSRQSSYMLFGQKTGDALADEIMDALDDAREEGMTQSEINRYFGSNHRSGRLRGALKNLEKAGWVRWEKAAKEGPGRPEIRWWSIREA